MSLLSLFKRKNETAKTAKERLQIVIAHERVRRNAPDFLPDLQRDIVEVISKYVNIDPGSVQVNLEQDGDCAVLDVNVTLPDD